MERTALLWLPSGTNTGCKQCGRHREHGRDLDASLVEEHRTPFAHAQDGRGATATDFGKGAEIVAYLIDGLVVRLRVGCDNREGVGSLHQLDRIEEVANRAVRDCSNKSYALAWPVLEFTSSPSGRASAFRRGRLDRRSGRGLRVRRDSGPEVTRSAIPTCGRRGPRTGLFLRDALTYPRPPCRLPSP